MPELSPKTVYLFSQIYKKFFTFPDFSIKTGFGVKKYLSNNKISIQNQPKLEKQKSQSKISNQNHENFNIFLS